MSKYSEQTKLERLHQQREHLKQEIAEIQKSIDEAVQGIIKLDRKMVNETSQRNGQRRRAA